MAHLPLFSIITPVYNTPIPVLRAMIESVTSQSFSNWELCLVDDCSPNPMVGTVLREFASLDSRIRVQRRAENGGIVPASNDCLAMARGEFVSFLDHDDELYPGALERVAEVLESDAEIDYVYTDEDKLDEAGHRHSPFFKPDWSPERFRYQMYTCHFGTMRRRLVEEVGGFRAEFEGSQDFDLVFRVSEVARKVAHIPEVLYGWRIISGSAAGDITAKPYAWIAGQRAIQAHCERVGFEATVEHDPEHQPGWYRLRPALTSTPLVSVLIPTMGASKLVRGCPSTLVERCVESLINDVTYTELEILVIADTVVSAATRDRLNALGGDRLRIIDFAKPFNFSEKINIGALHAEGDHLLMLNDDTEAITPDWIESMLMYSRHEPIGAVGAKLFFDDRRLQHAGVSLGQPHSGPAHVYMGFPGDYAGYFSTLRVAANYLAVTAACLMTRKDVFFEVGGMSERFPSSYNDIDFCLKVIDRGYRVAFDPEAELIHHESATRQPEVSPTELQQFRDRWWSYLGHDPYYNPNLVASPPNFMVPVTRTPQRVNVSQ